MQIYYNQLEKELQNKLKLVYIISGNEIYQEEACVEKILLATKKENYLEHEVLYVEKSFDWDSFDQKSSNLSLFSEKKVIELRFLTKTVSLSAQKNINEYIDSTNNDNILIIRIPALKATEYRKKYLGQNNDNVGLIRLFPITRKNMVDELNESIIKYKYKIDKNCLNFIVDLYEGNMVAANQALIKLDLMTNNLSDVNLDFLKKVFSMDVDFEATNLVDYSLEGNIPRIQKCFNFLKQNDYPAQYIIWSFIRSFRTILFNIESINNGKSLNEILKNIWPYERKNLMSHSLKKLNSKKIEAYLGILVRIDMQSKNVLDGNTWDSIYDLSISVAKNKLSVIKYN